ncbi:MAG: PQQ-binding-like beta-propeller repeat protein [Oscillospiraceae bacterium]|nr:PQQ-binding-like beta-propeller repeat protein [Oscillospiraceae bacterium]MCL2278103.1 PQQ-binding-like beta-propeller repeat protein [Oscillospiraceae bacterium]
MKKRKTITKITFLTLFAVLLAMPSACEIVLANGSVTFGFAEPSHIQAEPEITEPDDLPYDEYYEEEPEPEPERILEDDPLEGIDFDPQPENEEEVFTGPPLLLPFNPHATENTDPEIMIALHGINAGGTTPEDFLLYPQTDFGFSDDYAEIEGITTFRGNNFRDTASFGYANISAGSFGERWSRNTGSLVAPTGTVWTGHGWSGQPLIVRWPQETRAIMNMHDWAREQEDLVEVIYPSMDGFIYFLELTTGRDTRDRLNIGFVLKGTGAIDPRGYPLLYVGAGYVSAHGPARIFIISLIDGTVLHTFGNNDGFALRSLWHADASPLVDSENDRLFFPSENGLLYILDLNTEFDPDAGTISIDPTTVRWRFQGRRSHTNGQFWLGFEASPIIHRGHMFLADNGGHLICLDLNTLQPVWVKDVLDDTNTTPVLSIENGHPYLYASTGFHAGWRAPASGSAPIPVWKIDAVTGEEVWRTDFSAYTVPGLAGGVQGSIAIGRHSLDHLIFVPISRSPTISSSTLVALHKETGEVVWEHRSSTWSWSSPVVVYNEDGRGFIVHTTSNADIHLFDGLTGELLNRVSLGRLIEASPAVFESTVVIGTRCQRIIGIELT